MQFTWLTREEAAAYLARAPQTGDNVGDRIAAERRLMPVTTAAERAAARAFTEQRAREREREAFRRQLAAIPITTETRNG